MYTAGALTPTSSLPTTILRVAEVTQNSVRLGWNPLPGATGYILRWREETGETCYYTCYNLFLLDSYMPALQSYHFNCSHFSDIGRGLSVTLPAASSSYQVTGLRLGRRYRFTVQPTFTNGLGTESSVNERTGNTPTHALLYTYHIYKHLLIPYLPLQNSSIHSVCGWASGCGVSGAGIYRSD